MNEDQTAPVQASIDEETLELRSGVDGSLRFPVLALLILATLWLLFSSLIGFITSLESHSPDLLGGSGVGGMESAGFLSRLHYGLLKPIFYTSFVYGWCLQVGVAVALWIVARLNKTPLPSVKVLFTGIILWNVFLKLSIAGIAFGGNSSLQWLAFPKWAWLPLLFAYAMLSMRLIDLGGNVSGGKSAPYISQKYILAAVFFFPWIFATANLLLRHGGELGVMGPAVNSWYVSALSLLFFAPLALAAAYYLIPKITGKAIHSYEWSQIGLWSLLAIGGWLGTQRYLGGPLPSWLPIISGVASILFLIPVLIIALNFNLSTRGYHGLVKTSPTMRFTVYGAVCFTLLGILTALLTLNWPGRFFQYTSALQGLQMLGLYGFFSMIMFGAMYFMVPRLSGCEWPSSRLINLHFWLSQWGIVFLVSMYFLAGLSQGSDINNVAEWSQNFYGPAQKAAVYLRGASLAWIFLLIANSAFFVQLLLMALGLGRVSSEPTLLGHGGHQSEEDQYQELTGEEVVS